MHFLFIRANLSTYSGHPKGDPRKDPRSRGRSQEPWKLEEHKFLTDFLLKKGKLEHFSWPSQGGPQESP